MVKNNLRAHGAQGGAFAVLLACSLGASAQTVFVDTFGSTATRASSPYVPQHSGAGAKSYYRFADPLGDANSAVVANAQRVLLDGYYTVINPQNIRDPLPPPAFTGTPVPAPTAGGWWAAGSPGGDYTKFRDHTGDGGAILAVNAGTTQNHMYRRLVTLTPGRTYVLSAWLFMVQPPGDTQLSLREPDDSAAIATSAEFPVAGASDPAMRKWTERSWKFTLPASCVQTQYAVAYSNLDDSTAGNDLFIDDVSLVATTDTAGAQVVPCGTVVKPLPKITTQPETVGTAAGTAIAINVLANDTSSDPTNAPLSAPHADTSANAVKPANGTVTYEGGQAVYTPVPGFVGQDKFTYEVCTTATSVQPTPVCKTETVTVNVIGVTANPDEASTKPDTAVSIDVKANDTANAPLGVPTTVSPPSNGTVTWNASTGQALYTPAASFRGPTDKFTYQVCTTGTVVTCSAPAQVTVTVTPAPVTVTASPAKGATQPGKPVTIAVSYSSSDPTNAPLGAPTTVTEPANGSVTWLNGQAVYTPNAGFQGPSDSFTYRVCTAVGVTPQVCSSAQTVSVAIAAPIPVPANAAWALGLLSLGMLGFAGHRMRRRPD